MARLWKQFLAFLFPTRCVGCRREDYFICPACVRSLPNPERPTKDWVTSVWSYKDPRIKRLLWLIKFSGRTAGAGDLAQALYDHLSDELAERTFGENFTEPLLVPVPLTKKSFRKRGYNQSEMIARAIAEKSAGTLAIELFLTKVRETATQHGIRNKRERLRNLVGAYRASPKVSGRNIVVIDDITTTHATLAEARRALRAAGAKRVIALTVAH